MIQDTADTPVASGRISAIDSLRGLVMILMTLDHTRDFFSAAHFNPTDLDKTWPALFLTRWVTHFCAPVFVFLAGTSAYLWQARRGPGASVSRFLLERGLLLLALTLTVEALSWNFRNDFRHIDGGVLWAIAWSMLALAGAVKLPLRWTVVLGVLMMVSHNAFDGIKPADLGGFGPLWSVLHTGDDVSLGNGWMINPYYPLIPWLGVMMVGYGFGALLMNDAWRASKRLFGMGLILIAAFVVLRYANCYGDPDPWQVRNDAVYTVLSFINCHKYPPSLLYLLMTLGPALAMLGLLANVNPTPRNVLQVFGRTPLFFYLLHLYVIHLLALALAAWNGGPVSALAGGGIWSKELPATYGYGLPGVYGFWLLVVLLMYPCCRGLETLKVVRPGWVWLKYV